MTLHTHVHDEDPWEDGQAHCVLCGLSSDRWDVPCDPTYPDSPPLDQRVDGDGYGYCPTLDMAVDGYCPKCGDHVDDESPGEPLPYPFPS